VRLAIGSITRVDQRLLLFFWYAAGRWGRVGPDGTRVPFDLTHELLGELVGARRPSVTSALGELRDRGELERSSDGWLLRGAPPADVTRT
jgi:CRP-like cAMP-binding protein